jgi:hypothetical protein
MPQGTAATAEILDQYLRQGKPSDLDNGARRPIMGEIFKPNVGDVVERAHVGDVNGDIHHILHVGAMGADDGTDILEYLSSLGAQVPYADDPTLNIGSDLAGDEQQWSGAHAHAIRIIALERRRDAARVGCLLARLRHTELHATDRAAPAAAGLP